MWFRFDGTYLLYIFLFMLLPSNAILIYSKLITEFPVNT